MTERQQNQSFLNSTQLEFVLDNSLPWGGSGHPVYCRMLAVSLASTKHQGFFLIVTPQKTSTDIVKCIHGGQVTPDWELQIQCKLTPESQ